MHTNNSLWTNEEDEILRQMVNEYGTQKWVRIAEKLPNRIGRQCRERWINVLDPDINRKDWTPEEDKLLLKMHEEQGPKWSYISKMPEFKGRTISQIKNRFHQNLKCKHLKKSNHKRGAKM
jgi:hypothetical protein